MLVAVAVSVKTQKWPTNKIPKTKTISSGSARSPKVRSAFPMSINPAYQCHGHHNLKVTAYNLQTGNCTLAALAATIPMLYLLLGAGEVSN
jgi:hypothetical protein